MKQKLFTAFFAFLMIAGIAQAQQATGTIAGTVTNNGLGQNLTSGTGTIAVTDEGAYNVVVTIPITSPSFTFANIFLDLNGVTFPASINAGGLTPDGGATQVKVGIPVVIAASGNNTAQLRFVSSTNGSSTWGPFTLDFYTDASAKATQDLITALTTQVSSLTTAVNSLTTQNTAQDANIASLNTKLDSLSSQLAGINTNSSATQLEALQKSVNSLTKDIKRYGNTASNPFALMQFGLNGFTAVTSGVGTGMQSYNTFKGIDPKTLKNRPTKYVKP